jgi:hypothetical protein
MGDGNEVYCKAGLPFRCFAPSNLIKCVCCVAAATAVRHFLQMMSAISSLIGARGKTELHGFYFIFL